MNSITTDGEEIEDVIQMPVYRCQGCHAAKHSLEAAVQCCRVGALKLMEPMALLPNVDPPEN